MFLSAVSVLVVAQSSSKIPEGLMNNPVYMMGNKHETVTVNWLFVNCVMLSASYLLCDLQFGCSRQILNEAQELRKLCETESLSVVR